MDEHYAKHNEHTYMEWSHDVLFIYCITVFRRLGILFGIETDEPCIFVQRMTVYQVFKILITKIEPFVSFTESIRKCNNGDRFFHLIV